MGDQPFYSIDTVVRLVEENTMVRARNICLLRALNEAARSLETIANKAGKDESLERILQIRGYAESRAKVAYTAIAKAEGD